MTFKVAATFFHINRAETDTVQVYYFYLYTFVGATEQDIPT